MNNWTYYSQVIRTIVINDTSPVEGNHILILPLALTCDHQHNHYSWKISSIAHSSLHFTLSNCIYHWPAVPIAINHQQQCFHCYHYQSSQPDFSFVPLAPRFNLYICNWAFACLVLFYFQLNNLVNYWSYKVLFLSHQYLGDY